MLVNHSTECHQLVAQFDERNLTLRNRTRHLTACDELEAGVETSVDLGINYRSTLFELEHFDVDILVPDVMHDMLEGVLQYEASLILRYIIREKSFLSYTTFAEALDGLELGYMEADNKPTSIPATTLNSEDRSLGQKGELECKLGVT